MKERIKEIIAYLMDPESSELKDPSAIHGELEDMGYSHDEIKQALTIMDLEPILENGGNEYYLSTLTRILGQAEKLILSTSAQGYLLKLHHLGWISEAQLSLIIENASIECSPPVSIVEIKEIASRYVSDLPEDIHLSANRFDEQVN